MPVKPILICKACPSCGSHRYEKGKYPNALAFGHVRTCRNCDTLYQPPTHPVVAVFLLVIGVVMALPGLGLIALVGWRIIDSGGRFDVGPCTFFLPVLLAVIGIAAVVAGARGLLIKPVTPPLDTA